MRTLKEVNDELKKLRHTATSAPFTEQKRLKRQIAFYENVRLYLETNPREEFIKKEIDTLAKRIAAIELKFGEWARYQNGTNAELRRQYSKMYELPRLRSMLFLLKYLL